jgi:hypothetical protein
MTTHLLPDAEHILELALRRAEGFVRAGQVGDAIRCLEVAVAAADLIQDMEAEDLDVEWAAFDTDGNQP